jgi:hypothetical protein
VSEGVEEFSCERLPKTGRFLGGGFQFHQVPVRLGISIRYPDPSFVLPPYKKRMGNNTVILFFNKLFLGSSMNMVTILNPARRHSGVQVKNKEIQ